MIPSVSFGQSPMVTCCSFSSWLRATTQGLMQNLCKRAWICYSLELTPSIPPSRGMAGSSVAGDWLAPALLPRTSLSAFLGADVHILEWSCPFKHPPIFLCGISVVIPSCSVVHFLELLWISHVFYQVSSSYIRRQLFNCWLFLLDLENSSWVFLLLHKKGALVS